METELEARTVGLQASVVTKPLRIGMRVRVLTDVHDGLDSRPPGFLARAGDLLTVAVDQGFGRCALWVEHAPGAKPFRLQHGEYNNVVNVITQWYNNNRSTTEAKAVDIVEELRAYREGEPNALEQRAAAEIERLRRDSAEVYQGCDPALLADREIAEHSKGRFALVSTANITYQDSLKLAEAGTDENYPVMVANTGHGFIVSTMRGSLGEESDGVAEALRNAGMSDAFLKVFSAMRASGFDLINIDSDVNVLHGFEVFSW